MNSRISRISPLPLPISLSVKSLVGNPVVSWSSGHIYDWNRYLFRSQMDLQSRDSDAPDVSHPLIVRSSCCSSCFTAKNHMQNTSKKSTAFFNHQQTTYDGIMIIPLVISNDHHSWSHYCKSIFMMISHENIPGFSHETSLKGIVVET